MDVELIKALTTACAAFAGAALAAWVALRTSQKTLFVNTVTKERAEWRRDLRLVTAELVTLAHVALNNPLETLTDLHERRVGVRLRINPNGGAKHPLDQAIMDGLAQLPQLLRPHQGAPDPAQVLACLESLERNVQQLLKTEWDKSKLEARTGKLQDTPR